ncbi:MAG: homoserine dehydrogenase [Firmicutes bacterium]|nr:homoserine dehydrogenase [Bacillota bacterium]
MAKIAVLGYGTVGSGVVEVINSNSKVIGKNAGESVEVKYVLDLRDFPGDPVQNIITHDFNDIINDDEIEVVVEVMGGTSPAYEFVKASLEKGKSVCTSNKALVAKHGSELLRIAEENSVNFLFEASVGGGIPILRPLNNCITCEVIEEITGILNGTTNYMLTKMTAEGLEYADVLKDAQDKGYAERNPAADVEGHDTCRKIAILSSIVTGKEVNFEEIYTEGITKVTKTDIDYVKKMGKAIKLLATAKFDGGRMWARVAPVIIEPSHPLGNVSDVYNGILVKGNCLGDVMFYGMGAGKLPTASAVVSDIVDAVKNKHTNLGFSWSEEKQQLTDISTVEVSKFVRVSYSIKAEALNAVSQSFGDVDVVEAGIENELAFITPVLTEASIEKKLGNLANSEGISEVLSVIRMY